MSNEDQPQVTWEPKVNLERKHPRFFPLFNAYDVYGCISNIDQQDDTWSYDYCELRLRGHEFIMGLPSLLMWRIIPQILALSCL